MSEIDDVRKQVRERLSFVASAFMKENMKQLGDPLPTRAAIEIGEAHAMVEEFTRLELRQRALARAALRQHKRWPNDDEQAEVLRAIAEGRELPQRDALE
jgi:hypothetical protein